MSIKNIMVLLMILIIASSILSGCVEKNTPVTKAATIAKSDTSDTVEPPKLKSEDIPVMVVVAPTPQPEQKIPASEKPKLKIISPEIVSQGEIFTVTLALVPSANQKIIAVEINISTDNKIKIISIEFISSNPETDKIIRGGDITYADINGISGEFATIKFSGSGKGQAEITAKAIVVNDNQYTAELVSNKIINIA
ncbi:hypothetical protein KKB43_02740 [Patescibacteria group bacterium]|nr:hypothetical protein [Patescibacteria group bacterium]